MPEWRDLLLAEGSTNHHRKVARRVQHGTTTLIAGLQTAGTGDDDARGRTQREGAWRCGNRYALSTSPHPRRRLRTTSAIGVTLTFSLVQKIGQVSGRSRFP